MEVGAVCCYFGGGESDESDSWEVLVVGKFTVEVGGVCVCVCVYQQTLAGAYCVGRCQPLNTCCIGVAPHIMVLYDMVIFCGRFPCG